MKAKKKDPKRVAAGKKSSRKGRRGERGWSKELDVIFPEFAPWIRNKNIVRSGIQGQCDLIPDPKVGRWPRFLVECKSYSRVSWKLIRKWIQDTRKKAGEYDAYDVVLCLHVTGAPRMVFMTERYGEEREILRERCGQVQVICVFEDEIKWD